MIFGLFTDLRRCRRLVRALVQADQRADGLIERLLRKISSGAALDQLSADPLGRALADLACPPITATPGRNRLYKALVDRLLVCATTAPYYLTYAGSLVFHGRRDEPVLYRQQRFGEKMSPFTVYKFTTMVSGAEQIGGDECLNKSIHDPRIIGRWARFLRQTGLNELPQRINIQQGQMSTFGPRAYPLRTHQRVLEMNGQRRNDAVPGLISLSHMIHYHHHISVEAMLLFDIIYTQLMDSRLKIPLDLLTVLYMARVIIRGKNK